MELLSAFKGLNDEAQQILKSFSSRYDLDISKWESNRVQYFKDAYPVFAFLAVWMDEEGLVDLGEGLETSSGRQCSRWQDMAFRTPTWIAIHLLRWRCWLLNRSLPTTSRFNPLAGDCKIGVLPRRAYLHYRQCLLIPHLQSAHFVYLVLRVRGKVIKVGAYPRADEVHVALIGTTK